MGLVVAVLEGELGMMRELLFRCGPRLGRRRRGGVGLLDGLWRAVALDSLVSGLDSYHRATFCYVRSKGGTHVEAIIFAA